jgi:mannose-6-phosphate isomerase
MVCFYPLTFTSVYKPRIWGGRRLASLFDRVLPSSQQIGESWEVCDHGEDVSVVAHGELQGVSLAELRRKYAQELFGEQAEEHTERFPLLLKFIDAEEKLSLQVHPDTKYALQHANDLGKAEAWYVIDAMPGAQVTRGFRAGMTKEKALKAIQHGRLETVVNNIPVEKGDGVFIPAGALHGIGSGLVLAEIQQNSDVTYRVHDYGRTDGRGRHRPLHIEQAMSVLSFRDLGAPKLKPVKVTPLHQRLIACDHFSLYVYHFREPIHEYSLNRFRILCNIEGHGTVISPEGVFEDVDFHPGTSILIPAAVRDFSLVPATHCVMLDIIPGKMTLRKQK